MVSPSEQRSRCIFPGRTRYDFLQNSPNAFFDKGFQSACSVPLVAQGRVVGVLTMGSMRENALTEEDIELLTQIAQQIALATDNAMAYREIERLKNKLTEEKLYLEDEIRAKAISKKSSGKARRFARSWRRSRELRRPIPRS